MAPLSAAARVALRCGIEKTYGDDGMNALARSLTRRAFVCTSAVLAARGLHAAERAPQENAKPLVGVYYYPWYRSPRAGRVRARQRAAACVLCEKRGRVEVLGGDRGAHRLPPPQ